MDIYFLSISNMMLTHGTRLISAFFFHQIAYLSFKFLKSFSNSLLILKFYPLFANNIHHKYSSCIYEHIYLTPYLSDLVLKNSYKKIHLPDINFLVKIILVIESDVKLILKELLIVD